MEFWSSIEELEFDLRSAVIKGSVEEFVEGKGSIGSLSESTATLEAIDEFGSFDTM